MELRLNQVEVRRGAHLVLSGISATFVPGRITVVLGANGAGKTSLLMAMAGLLPVSGTVMLGERAAAALDPRARARLIGYLPQEPALHWNMSVVQAVALGRLPHRARFAQKVADDPATARAMAQTDVASLADRLVNTLSGGERARVLLARVLAGEPRWLLADEPLASLDPAHQLDLLDRLRALARAGTGVVLVLHDLAHAARVADEVVFLQRGQLAAHGPAESWLTPAMIGQVFGVAAHLHPVPGGRALPVVTDRLAD